MNDNKKIVFIKKKKFIYRNAFKMFVQFHKNLFCNKIVSFNKLSLLIFILLVLKINFFASINIYIFL